MSRAAAGRGRAGRSGAGRTGAGRDRAARGRSGRPVSGPRPGRRIAAGVAMSFVLMLVLLIGVFPTRQWLAQRDDLGDRQSELARQQAESERLERRIATLQTDEEVERIARQEFGMVRPGEEAFRVLPPAVDPVDLPDAWPFTGANDWLNR